MQLEHFLVNIYAIFYFSVVFVMLALKQLLMVASKHNLWSLVHILYFFEKLMKLQQVNSISKFLDLKNQKGKKECVHAYKTRWSHLIEIMHAYLFEKKFFEYFKKATCVD